MSSIAADYIQFSATNEEMTSRAGKERIQYIVTSRMEMAGHLLRKQAERPTQPAMYWVPETAEERRGGRGRHGGVHSKKTKKR